MLKVLPDFWKAVLWALSASVLIASGAYAQTATLAIQPVWGAEPLQLNEPFSLQDSRDSLTFTALRFYLSAPIPPQKRKSRYLSQQGQVWLYDLEKPASVTPRAWPVHKGVMQVCVGLDSLYHVAGALPGILDPVQGMYWAWQSGYIHVKIEGYSKACPGRLGRFQFHLGGYLPPHETMRLLSFEPVQGRLDLSLDLKQFFEGVDIRTEYEIMTPGPAADRLSTLFADCLKEKP